MQRQNSLLMMAGGTLGIVGTLALFSWPVVGGVILLIALGMVFGPLLLNRTSRPIPQQTQIEVPQQNQRVMQEFISKPVMTGEMSMLARKLRKANLNPRAPVLVGDHNETLASLQDILEEIITQAKGYNFPVSELDIVKIYGRIFENVEAACKVEPTSVDATCIWLANRSLKDVCPHLDDQPAEMQASRYDLMIDEPSK